MYHVYVLENETTTEKYIGYTMNLRQRLADHNRHKNISTTHGSHWKLIYCETYLNKMDALGREKFLKSGSGWRFLKKQLTHYLADSDSLQESLP
jgi:putative endonuclease